jgi:hypothetical protein
MSAADLITSLPTLPTSDARRTAAEALADKHVKGKVAEQFKNLQIEQNIAKFAADKKNANAREAAMLLVTALAESLEEAGEPYTVPMLTTVLETLGDKQENVRNAAQGAANALLSIQSPHAVKLLLPVK